MKTPLFLITFFLCLISCSEDEQIITTEENKDNILSQENLPLNLIPMNEAMDKIHAYQETKTNELVANSAHMNLQELKRYLTYAESKMTMANKDMSGLEVYFGRYLDEEKGHHLKGQISLIYFPTYRDENGHDIPFDFVSEKPIREIYETFQNGDALQNRSSGSSAWNKLNMSPPRMPKTI